MQESTKVLPDFSLLNDVGGAIRKTGFRFPCLAAKWLFYRVGNVVQEAKFHRVNNVNTGFIAASDERDFAGAAVYDPPRSCARRVADVSLNSARRSAGSRPIAAISARGQIGCPEEVALCTGYIDAVPLESIAAPLLNAGYGIHPMSLLAE